MWRKPRLGVAREQLDRRRTKEADVVPLYITGPGPSLGLWEAHGPHGESAEIVASALGRQSFRPGAVVMAASFSGQGGKVVFSHAPPGQMGTAEFAFPPLIGARMDAVGLVRADPSILTAGGAAQSVVFTGFGLNQNPLDLFRAVLYNATTRVWDTDSLITLGAVTWVSSTQVTIPVTVSSTAPDGYEISIEVVRA